MPEFPTRRVDRSQFQLLEQLGSKPKFWFRDGEWRLQDGFNFSEPGLH
jgi:hypothetical protein